MTNPLINPLINQRLAEHQMEKVKRWLVPCLRPTVTRSPHLHFTGLYLPLSLSLPPPPPPRVPPSHWPWRPPMASQSIQSSQNGHKAAFAIQRVTSALSNQSTGTSRLPVGLSLLLSASSGYPPPTPPSLPPSLPHTPRSGWSSFNFNDQSTGSMPLGSSRLTDGRLFNPSGPIRDGIRWLVGILHTRGILLTRRRISTSDETNKSTSRIYNQLLTRKCQLIQRLTNPPPPPPPPPPRHPPPTLTRTFWI